MKTPSLEDCLQKITFGFEQTFTVENWWAEQGFTHVSDTPLKREKMLHLAQELTQVTGGQFIESQDIYQHLQYETFLPKPHPVTQSNKSFVITMDPGSIEVKTPPCLIHEVEQLFEPLFLAAKNAGLVPYRNWWYGIQGGTEGGCHVNLGTRDLSDHPFIQHPYFLLQYFTLLHNHPELHYPFMGIDVGPGGNAQRMDEKNDFELIKNKFKEAAQLHSKNALNYSALMHLFKGTSLLTEPSSAPSLAKFKEPNFVLEDRAQESFRSAQDAKLVSELKYKLLQITHKTNPELKLHDFGPTLHQEFLTSFFLWKRFQQFCEKHSIQPDPYSRFFERQFPRLSQGTSVPQFIKINEGRRPRKILSETKRNGLVVSKTIDSTYKRFEVYFMTDLQDLDSYEIKVESSQLEHVSALTQYEGAYPFDVSKNLQPPLKVYYLYIDLKVNKDDPLLNLQLIKNAHLTVETAKFNTHNMAWE